MKNKLFIREVVTADSYRLAFQLPNWLLNNRGVDMSRKTSKGLRKAFQIEARR